MQLLFPPQMPQTSYIFPLFATPSQPAQVELSPKQSPHASLFELEPPHTPQSSNLLELPDIPSQPTSNNSLAPGSCIRISPCILIPCLVQRYINVEGASNGTLKTIVPESTPSAAANSHFFGGQAGGDGIRVLSHVRVSEFFGNSSSLLLW